MSRKIKLRSILIGVLFTLFFVFLVSKLYMVQVVNGQFLLQKAEASWNASEVLLPKRGTITDRNDKVLAEDADAYTVAVNPKLIHEDHLEDKAVGTLAPILGMDNPTGLQRLRGIVTSKTDDGQFYAQREIRNEGWKIDKDKADLIKKAVSEQGLSGIYLLPEQKRYYPADNLASHVIGYTNKENAAVTGIEYYYDKLLHGKKGSFSYQKDRNGYELPDSQASLVPPVDGKTLRLTIDENIQSFTEEALAKTFAKYQPKEAMALVVNPQTMEVLASANLPDFDPNHYWDYDGQTDFIDHVVTSQYEPGSTFKLVTLTGAIDQGIFKPDDKYQSGSISLPGGTLHDHNYVGWGKISYLEGLERSSNVAFVKLGYEGLGPDKLKEYIDRFGFGHKTGIDLPGEDPGVIDPRYPIEYATATYGQGRVSATPIQLAAAYAAIANGGKLMKPYVVKDVIDPATGKSIKHTDPTVVRQVVSPEVANETKLYLEKVVTGEHGTGKDAAIPGYRVAGKTGTANVVADGKYMDGASYLMSFVGFAPVENPQVLVLVMVNLPHVESYHEGGATTLPVFREIMSKTLRYLGVGMSEQPKEEVIVPDASVTMPDLAGKSANEAKAALSRMGLSVQVVGGGAQVLKQYPLAGTQTTAGARTYLITEDAAKIPVPDLTGDSLRDAMTVCSIIGAECRVEGQGYVASQSVSGSGKDRVVVLRLRPPDAGAAAGGNAADAGAGGSGGTSGDGASTDPPPASDSPLARASGGSGSSLPPAD